MRPRGGKPCREPPSRILGLYSDLGDPLCPPPTPEQGSVCYHLLQDSGMSSGSRAEPWRLTGRLSGLSLTRLMTMNGPPVGLHFCCSLVLTLVYPARLSPRRRRPCRCSCPQHYLLYFVTVIQVNYFKHYEILNTINFKHCENDLPLKTICKVQKCCQGTLRWKKENPHCNLESRISLMARW